MALLASGLRAKGVLVHIFILNRPRTKNKHRDFIQFDCPHYYLFDNRYFKSLSGILFTRYIKNNNYDILLINGAQRNIEIAIKSKKYINNIFIAIRNLRFIHYDYYKVGMLKIINNNFKIICNSQSIKNSLEHMFNMKKNMIKVINNGIDQMVSNIDRGKLSEFKVMFVGNLRDVKNPIFFLKVAEKLIKDDKLSMLFYIVGDGPLMHEVKQFINKHDLSCKIKLLGKLPNNKIPFDDISLLFNCSISEGSSNSILESLTFGKPVVASDNEGNREILSESGFGRIYKNNEVDSAVEQIEYFYKLDDDSISNIANEAKRFINTNYNKELMINEYYDYFQGLDCKIKT